MSCWTLPSSWRIYLLGDALEHPSCQPEPFFIYYLFFQIEVSPARQQLWAAAWISISTKLLPKAASCPGQGHIRLELSSSLQEKGSFRSAVSGRFHQNNHNPGSVSPLDSDRLTLLILVIVVRWGSWKLAKWLSEEQEINIPSSKSVRKFPQWIMAENKHVFVLPENQQD